MSKLIRHYILALRYPFRVAALSVSGGGGGKGAVYGFCQSEAHWAVVC